MSIDEFNLMFAKNLKYFMDLNGYSQAELSREIGVSESTVHTWLHAQRTPRMARIDQLCSLFGVNRSDLITDDAKKKEGYYVSEHTKEIANAIARDKELQLLFDAARNASPQDLKTVHEILKVLKDQEANHD